MTNFAVASPEILDNQTDIEGLRSVEDFDVLVRTVGQSLLAKLVADYPGIPTEDVSNSMYPLLTRNAGGQKQPFRVADKLRAFDTPPDTTYFGHIVSPTLPENMWHVRGYLSNVLTGVTNGPISHCLETRVHVNFRPSSFDYVSVRKLITPRVESVATSDLPAYVARKRRDRIQRSRLPAGYLIPDDVAARFMKRSEEHESEQLHLDI